MQRRFILACALVLTACPDRPNDAAPGPTPVASSTVAPLPPAPSLTPVAPAPSGPTHFAQTTAPAANAACKPLPKGGPRTASALAGALRRLSCEPALFMLSSAALKKELSLPEDHKVELSGPSTVSIEFSKGRAADLATAMGVPAPVAARSKTGAWSWRIWNLASAKAGKLDLWGPGTLTIGVDIDGTVADAVERMPLGDTKLEGYASVTMPESALPLRDDAPAVAMLLAGLERLSQDKSQLARDPQEAARFAGLDDARFRVSRRSVHGKSVIDGLDLWTARTRVAAGAVIQGLGLSGKIEHSRAHDSDEHLLFAGSSTEFAWRGLKLTLRFDARDGAAAPDPYCGHVLSGVTVMP